MVVLHSLLNILDSVEDTDFNLPSLKQNTLKLEFSCDNKFTPNYNAVEPPLPFAVSDVFHADIVQSKRLTAEGDCKAIYEVIFDVEGSNFDFKAGDTIGIIPHNDETGVNFVLSHLDLKSQADLCYTLLVDSSIKGGKRPAHVPMESTVRHVMTHCLDLRSIMKKLFLLALSKYTKDEKERKILEYLCSKEGSSAYTSDIVNKGLCVLDIFNIFPSCRPPIEILLAHLPRLLPRPYSIVNSGLKNNKTVIICFSVMTIKQRKGLTTGWIESLITNDDLNNQMSNLSISNERRTKIPMYLRKNMNTFSLPKDTLKKPLILIGPGTGIAPFIGFLEEIEYMEKNNPHKSFGKVWLFFGCRNPKLDFIYEDELNGYLSRGVLSKLSTAFSRIDNNIKYIQDALTVNLKDITKLLNDGAVIYICGDLKNMYGQIKEILVKGLEEHDNCTLEKAKARIAEMEENKTFLVDAWS